MDASGNFIRQGKFKREIERFICAVVHSEVMKHSCAAGCIVVSSVSYAYMAGYIQAGRM